MKQVQSMMGLESDFGYEHIPGIPSTDYGFGAETAAPQVVIQTPAPAKAIFSDVLLKALGWGAIIGAGLFTVQQVEKKHLLKKFPKMLRF